MADLVFWQTLLAGSAGGGITLAGQWLRGRQERANAIDALHRERDLAKADRRDQFELETLAEVRELMGALIDVAEDVRNAIDEYEEIHGGDASELWWDSTDGRRYADAQSRLRRSATSLLDEEVRAQVGHLIDEAGRLVNGGKWSEFLHGADLALEAVGRRVRALYGPEVSTRYQEGR